MQNKDKIRIITNLINEIKSSNNEYSDEIKGIYFDYEGVIELLQSANEMIRKTVRCPKPKNIPEDIPWSESMDVEDEFDPYVYNGNMSVKDFREAQRLYLESND